MIPPEARLLRVYLNAHDRWHHQPLYQAVVEKARRAGEKGRIRSPADIRELLFRKTDDQNAVSRRHAHTHN